MTPTASKALFCCCCKQLLCGKTMMVDNVATLNWQQSHLQRVVTATGTAVVKSHLLVSFFA